MKYTNSTKRSIYNLFKIINIISITTYFIWYITPLFRAYFYGGFSNIVVLFLLVIWFITAIILNPKWFFQFNLHLVIVSIQITVFIVMAILEPSTKALSYMNLGISFWFTLYVFHFYASIGWEKTIGRISTILIISLSITTVTTIVGLFSMPNAARILTSSSSSLNESILLNSKNIGGFDLVYGLIVAIPSLISFIITKGNNKYVKIIFSLFVLTVILLVFNASFTIAIFSLAFSILLGLLSRFKPKSILLLLLLIGIIYTSLPKESISIMFKDIAQVTDNTFVKDRFEDIGNFVGGSNNTAQNLYNRTQKYQMSFDTFVDNPITGVGGYYYVDGVGVGYHSQILDDLARYGVLGLLFYILFFYYFYKYVKIQWFKSNFKSNFFVALLTFLFISLLNPTFSSQSISVILFFLLPSLPQTLKYMNKDFKSSSPNEKIVL